MILSGLPSPAETGLAKAGNRYRPRIMGEQSDAVLQTTMSGAGLFGILHYRASHSGTRLIASARADGLVPLWTRPLPSAEKAIPVRT